MSDLTYDQTTWSLADIFQESKDEVEAAFTRLEEMVADFETRRSALRSDISFEEFQALVRSLEQIQELGYRLYGYAGLGFSANLVDMPVVRRGDNAAMSLCSPADDRVSFQFIQPHCTFDTLTSTSCPAPG